MANSGVGVLMNSLTSSVGRNLRASAASSITGGPSNINVAALSTNFLGGATTLALRGLLGMDNILCPYNFLGNNRWGNQFAGDMCGKNDNPLKSALLQVGLALAAPGLVEAGKAMADYIGPVNGLGGVMSSVSGATGISANTLQQTVGVGASTVLNGGTVGSAGVNSIMGGATAIKASNNNSSGSWLSGAKSMIGF
jgi:hypothetical protein